MEILIKPNLYLRVRNVTIGYTRRHFSLRSRNESFGLGMPKRGEGRHLNEYYERIENFYNNSNMQKLLNNTYERIATLQETKTDKNLRKAAATYQSSNSDKNLDEGIVNINNTGQHQSSAAIKKLTNDSKLPPKEMFSLDDQAKMRISFAEGYFYGQTRKTKSNRFLVSTLLFCTIGHYLYKLIFGENMAQTVRRRFKINLGHEISPEEIAITFADVKGCDESKQELTDVVEFLQNPEKYSRLGGKLPKGVLLVGPPGTGKTLLAKAVAGEANVPFFYASGSEFDELLVGQGARRVRDLFLNAKSRAPCVIFIDEIDSVGGKRSSSVIHPYANQTINQLLSEMDGFTPNEGVIVLGATNRQSDLDQALLRPGRFDVRVDVPRPEYEGRKELFEHYLGLVKASPDIDLDVLCRTTVGFTGADIENIVNQAAIKSATDNLDAVTQESLEFARDKTLMGPEKKSRLPDEETNLMTAYHEGGHALVSLYTRKADPLHKVTIISRGNSLGHTSFVPEKDMHSLTKEQLLSKIDVMLGGRMAEELIFGPEKVTTGCENDLKKANMVASRMVKDLGMSDKIGIRVMSDEDEGGNSQIIVKNGLSDATSELVESEIKQILDDSQARVRTLLTEHKGDLELLAKALVKYETLDAAEVKHILDGGLDPKGLHQQDREKKQRNSKSNNYLYLGLLK